MQMLLRCWLVQCCSWASCHGEPWIGNLVIVLTDFTNLLTSFLGDEKKQSFHGGFKTEDRSVRGQADALTLYLQICHEIPERQEDCIFEICNCESVGANTKVIQMRCLQVGFWIQSAVGVNKLSPLSTAPDIAVRYLLHQDVGLLLLLFLSVF